MKIDEIKKELRSLSVNDLKGTLDKWQRELFSLRLKVQTSHVKDYSQFAALRKNIARVLTYLKQKKYSKTEQEVS